MSDYIHVKIKPPYDSEKVASLFWSYPEFSQTRQEMTAYFKKEKPEMSDEQIEFIVTRFVDEMAREAYKYENNFIDMLSLLKTSYLQKRLKDVRLQSNGKTAAKNEKDNEPMTFQEKIAVFVFAVAIIGFIVDWIIGLFN